MSGFFHPYYTFATYSMCVFHGDSDSEVRFMIVHVRFYVLCVLSLLETNLNLCSTVCCQQFMTQILFFFFLLFFLLDLLPGFPWALLPEPLPNGSGRVTHASFHGTQHRTQSHPGSGLKTESQSRLTLSTHFSCQLSCSLDSTTNLGSPACELSPRLGQCALNTTT